MRMGAAGQAAHCSLSMSMSFSSKSLMRSWLAASNMNVTESPWSSACIHAGSHGCVLWLAIIENNFSLQAYSTPINLLENARINNVKP